MRRFFLLCILSLRLRAFKYFLLSRTNLKTSEAKLHKLTMKILVTCLFIFFSLVTQAASNDIDCSDSILTGLPFNRCGLGEVRARKKVGENQNSWANFVDGASELQVRYHQAITDGGGLTRNLNKPSEILARLKTVAPTFTTDSSNWGPLIEKSESDYFVSYERPGGKKCLAFFRRGDKIYTDTWKWMMYAFFCRMSETPIPVSEGEFLVNLIKIKNN